MYINNLLIPNFESVINKLIKITYILRWPNHSEYEELTNIFYLELNI